MFSNNIVHIIQVHNSVLDPSSLGKNKLERTGIIAFVYLVLPICNM